MGDTVKSIFDPGGNKKTPAEYVSEYAYNELDHQIPLKKLKESFEKTYNSMKHSEHRMSDEDWVHDQVKNVIPELKKKYDEANKSAAASQHHERDTGEEPKKAKLVYEGNDENPVEWLPEYAYDKLDHHVPLQKLRDRFGKSHVAMKHSGTQTSDAEWINDQINNVIPEIKKKYDEDEANKSASASRHHGRERGDKPRPKPGEPEHYIDPSFFLFPMPPTPKITEELKASLGDAFNLWRANTTEVAKSSYSAACSKADSITTKVDYTSKEKRKEIVEACIESLIDHPSCLGKYQSTNVLKPYLAELVDKGTIKDEDGVIKKFYKRMVIRAGGSVTPELALSQNFKDILANAFKKYKEDIAFHSDMSCPMTKENAYENSSLVSGAGFDTSRKEREHVLETCIVFLSWHPNCLQRYETTNFIEPHPEALAESGKIGGYVPSGSEKRDDLAHTPEPQPDDSPEPDPDDSKGGLTLLDQYFKELLGRVFNDYKKDVTEHSDMSCPLSKENACENSTLLSAAEADIMDFEERRWRLETCVIFLSWHPNYLQRYETKDFIKPYLEDLADRGKIKGYAPDRSESET